MVFEVTTSNSISLADVNKGLQLFTKVELQKRGVR